MKDMKLLIWLTQLGLCVALPLGGFILLGVWLHRSCGWGVWAVIAGVLVGLICAVDGLRSALKAMERMQKPPKEADPPAGFNTHH